MKSLHVRDAADVLGVGTERVFGLAFEYWETPHSKQYVVEQFLKWFYDGTIHPVVEDFIIDVLAHRIQVPQQLKDKEMV